MHKGVVNMLRSTNRLIWSKERWIVQFGARKRDATLQLLCFPFAGGNAMEFRSWATALPSCIDVLAVQLPGRGLRFGEPAITVMDDLIDSLLREVGGLLDRPLALFGHSLGGRIAFAFAERLSVAGAQVPKIVVVSASRPPGRLGKHDFTTFTDVDLRRYLMQLGGTAPEFMLNDELADLMLPVIRADFRLYESISAPSSTLNCPVIACGGIDDRTVSEADLVAWADLTSSSFEIKLFPGGHFYLREVRQHLLSFMAERFRGDFTLAGTEGDVTLTGRGRIEAD